MVKGIVMSAIMTLIVNFLKLFVLGCIDIGHS